MKKVSIKIPSELAEKIKGNKEKFAVMAIKEKIKKLKKKK
jgi:hypothetical protein